MSKKIVLLQGTFEIINWGHVKAFEEAKSLGDYLIVALNTDALVKDFKNKDSVLPWYQKAFIIKSFKYVDKVIPAPEFSPLNLLKKYKVDVYCLTKEWEHTKAKEMEYMRKKGGKVHFLPRYKGVVCTTDIRKKLLEEAKAKE